VAESAAQTQYRNEVIDGYEQRKSLLQDFVTTEAVIKGNTATFLVADSGGATAKTRGLNGMIPSRADSLTQTSATLEEWHDLVRKSNFNIFISQGNQRAVMQKSTMGTINRKSDALIITQLDTATNDTGAATTGSLSLVLKAKTILGVNEVPFDGQICGLITPAFEAYLLQATEFSSADYVTRKPMEGGTAWSDQPGFYRWLGVNWVVHPNLTGVGTSSEKCYMFHKSAIGHAVDVAGMDTNIGYDGEQAYSWCRVSAHMGSKLLQNSGVVQMLHDGSAFAAS
jgi:hypothetical protein